MMKIRFFACAALAITLATCSKENPANPGADGSVAAEFYADINPVTRINDAGNDWIDGDRIGITGIGTGYDNVPYVRKNDRFVPEPDGTIIYYETTDEVTFRAYYPYQPEGGIVSVSTAADKQGPAIDFLFASGATGSAGNAQVSFTDKTDVGGDDCSFHHCMSQICLVFVAGSGVDVTNFQPSDYTIYDLIQSGTFDTATGVATAGSAGRENLKMELNGALESSVIIFPQLFDSSTAQLDVTCNGHTYTAEIDIPNKAFKAGASYKYKVKINNRSIDIVSAEITEWIPGTDGGDGGFEADL